MIALKLGLMLWLYISLLLWIIFLRSVDTDGNPAAHLVGVVSTAFWPVVLTLFLAGCLWIELEVFLRRHLRTRP